MKRVVSIIWHMPSAACCFFYGLMVAAMSDEPTCAGCGIPLSPDEIYACADCSDWWSMNGLDIEKEKGDETTQKPKV